MNMKLRRCKSKIRCARAFPGAKGNKLCPEDVDRKQLRMGIAVELEHGKSRARACSTALDHLAEHDRYYSKHKKARL